MHIERTLATVMLMAVVAVSGCHSIHSDAVRELIKREGMKIDAAQTNIDLFQKETEDRIKLLDKSRDFLKDSYKSMQMQEAKHALVFSSYQNVSKKEKEDVYAVAFLLGKIFLAEYEGLEKKVWDQFEEDFCALREAATRLNDSWKALGTIHSQIERYADKSVLASVDPKFLAAVVEQVPRGSERLSQVLDNSTTVNDALQEVVGAGIFRARALERTRSLTADLIELLERAKTNP